MPEPEETTEETTEETSSFLGPKSAGAGYATGRIGSPDVILSRKNVFDALDEIFLETNIQRGSMESMKWFRELVREMFEDTELSPEETVLRDRTRLIQKSGYKRLGGMYLFNYLPRNRTKLKYYDTVPLIFLLNYTKDGFLGLNLHYLPPKMREKFFMLIRRHMRGSINNKWSRLELPYEMLKSKRQFRYYRPCIKRYKTKNIGSRMLHIYPKDWDLAIHLPIHRFKKAYKNQVWVESRQKLIEERQGAAEQ